MTKSIFALLPCIVESFDRGRYIDSKLSLTVPEVRGTGRLKTQAARHSINQLQCVERSMPRSISNNRSIVSNRSWTALRGEPVESWLRKLVVRAAFTTGSTINILVHVLVF